MYEWGGYWQTTQTGRYKLTPTLYIPIHCKRNNLIDPYLTKNKVNYLTKISLIYTHANVLPLMVFRVSTFSINTACTSTKQFTVTCSISSAQYSS